MNQSSSRSHLIVRITVESRPSAHQAPSGGAAGAAAQTDPAGVPTVPHAAGAGPSDAVVVSTISFVDLAGSERLNQASSGAVSALGGDVTEVEREKTRQKEVRVHGVCACAWGVCACMGRVCVHGVCVHARVRVWCQLVPVKRPGLDGRHSAAGVGGRGSQAGIQGSCLVVQ